MHSSMFYADAPLGFRLVEERKRMSGGPGGVEIRARISQLRPPTAAAVRYQQHQHHHQVGDVLVSVGFKGPQMRSYLWEVVCDYTLEDTMIVLEEAKKAGGRVLCRFRRPDSSAAGEDGDWKRKFGSELQLDDSLVNEQLRPSLGNYVTSASSKQVRVGPEYQCPSLPLCQPKPHDYGGDGDNNAFQERELVTWPAETVKEFERAIKATACRDFKQLAVQLSQPVGQVVEFYYARWKTTAAYQKWNRSQKRQGLVIGRCEGCLGATSLDCYPGGSIPCSACHFNFYHLECLVPPQPRLGFDRWNEWKCSICGDGKFSVKPATALAVTVPPAKPKLTTTASTTTTTTAAPSSPSLAPIAATTKLTRPHAPSFKPRSSKTYPCPQCEKVFYRIDHLLRHDKVHAFKPKPPPKPVEEFDNCGDCVGCREMIKFGTQAVGCCPLPLPANMPLLQKRKCSFPIRVKTATAHIDAAAHIDTAVTIDSVAISAATVTATTTTTIEDASEEEEEKEDAEFALKPKRKRRRDRSRASRDEHGRKKYFIEGVKSP
ncbi:hypothetical protein BASA81_015756 [Batrachochytrium salamandrivorans]|nr:hypothetical protein BASA81_015756 [Batrachochytrium salamandrivorans]